jgi:hypothetical protein
MNAIAQTRMAHMEHRQIVTQNATEMQSKYVVVLTPILFIRHRIPAVIYLFFFFNKCSHHLLI